MRKKSHISLATFILNSNGMEELKSYKKSFYFGSILPDCVPSFLTRKHNIKETFDVLEQEIRKITEDYDLSKGINMYYCRHLGVITHYVADYFTFPHNSSFLGTLTEHCIYEKHLKYALKEYVNSDEAKRTRMAEPLFKSVNDITAFIKRMHDEYLKVIKEIKVDCHYIVELCFCVVDAILQYIEYKRKSENHRIYAVT